MKQIAQSNNHLFGSYSMMCEINTLLEHKYNQKRIARLMCIHGLQSVLRKSKKKYCKVEPETKAENQMNRKFEAERPNEKWCTDVTEDRIPNINTKVYISTIIDFYDKYPVGYSIGLRDDVALVQASLDMALLHHNGENTMFHSDRGFQYTRKAFEQQLEQQSMSRVGRCIDNGPIESYQGLMKMRHIFYMILRV